MGKSSLDDVILSGAELKKHSTDADNGRRLDQELSATKDHYQTLVSGGDDRLARLEEALPLANTFHDMHEKVLSWLQRVEPELQPGAEHTGIEGEKQLDVSVA